MKFLKELKIPQENQKLIHLNAAQKNKIERIRICLLIIRQIKTNAYKWVKHKCFGYSMKSTPDLSFPQSTVEFVNSQTTQNSPQLTQIIKKRNLKE